MPTKIMCEPLESRVLLSASAAAASAPPIGGTYTGMLHADAGHLSRAGFSLTFASAGMWPLSGSMTMAGLGTVSFAGATSGGRIRAVFAGSGPVAGELTAHFGPGGRLAGSIVENIGSRSIRGTFSAHPGGSPMSAGGAAIHVGRVRFSQVNVTGAYVGAAQSNGTRTTLELTAESASGLVGGTLNMGNQAFASTGIVRGDRVDLILSDGGVLMLWRSANSLRGTMLVNGSASRIVLVNPSASQVRASRAATNGATSASSTSSLSSGAATTVNVNSSAGTSTSLVVSGLGEFANIGGLTAFGSGFPNPFGSLNTITATTTGLILTTGAVQNVPGTTSTGVLSGGTLPSTGNTTGINAAIGSGLTTGAGASPPVGTTSTVPGTSNGVVGNVPVPPTTNPATSGPEFGTPIFGTNSPGFT